MSMQKNISQATILLGLSGSGLSGDGKLKTSFLMPERFGTLFVIGLLTNLPHGDVTMETPTHANLQIRRSCVDCISSTRNYQKITLITFFFTLL